MSRPQEKMSGLEQLWSNANSKVPLILFSSQSANLVANYYVEAGISLRRYSDIMVHRLLAVAIGALDSYPDLLSKDKTQVGVTDDRDPRCCETKFPAFL